jgi:hypothetical protein
MTQTKFCHYVHDNSYYLAASIAAFRAAGEVFAFISRLPGMTNLATGRQPPQSLVQQAQRLLSASGLLNSPTVRLLWDG